MRAALDFIYVLCGVLAALLVVFIGAVTLAQVGANAVNFLTDAFLGEPVGANIPSYADFAGFGLAAATFLALPLAKQKGVHVRVHLLLDSLPTRARYCADAFCHALSAFAASFLAVYLWILSAEAMEFGDVSPGLIAIPLWSPRAAMAFGASVFAISLLDGFAAACRGFGRAKESANP